MKFKPLVREIKNNINIKSPSGKLFVTWWTSFYEKSPYDFINQLDFTN